MCFRLLQRPLLLELQAAVLPRFIADRLKAEKTKGDWAEAVRQAQTLSRLHLLSGILDSSIEWSKSAENAVSSASKL